jgi:hypothetical protein
MNLGLMSVGFQRNNHHQSIPNRTLQADCQEDYKQTKTEGSTCAWRGVSRNTV